MPILFATSPLAVMRSAPTITQLMPSVFIRCAAAASAFRLTGMPSPASSQAVSRAPCSQGRVSSANTRSTRPATCAARITPSAVPKPPVASAPVLQWVRIFCGPLCCLRISSTPSWAMVRLASRSLSWMATASAAMIAATSSPALSRNKRSRMRLSAQNRLAPVGRELNSSSKSSSRAISQSSPSARR
ncbi:hypothetical protein D9M73_169930 [compost metagenome]